MRNQNSAKAGPVDTSRSPFARWKTLDQNQVKINGGFWAKRQEVNHSVSLLHAYAMLEKAGNLHNLRLAAGLKQGTFVGRVFSDETVYKWLEALGWELGRAPDARLSALADEVITIIQKAQQSDGYLDSYYQIVAPDQKFTDLDHGHELYCAGHLIQAAVAFQRSVGDSRLLDVVCKLADHIDSVLGPGKKQGTCGHPEIEMALVELYRTTGEERYLRLAQYLLDQRGKGVMSGYAGYGPEYHQDHAPVRTADEITGHAVRQMYLLSGVSDVSMETGEKALLDASQRLWDDLVRSKLYITGGVGARYDGEAFGAAYELPPDMCYCETCAAIGSLMWNWRLLLLTGDGRYADLIERTLYNGILSSPALDGSHFYYVNPLMLRNGRYVRLSSNPPEGKTLNGRPEWHSVACCPPNVMRLMASLSHYFTTQDSTGVQIHQYGTAEICVNLPSGGKAVFQMDSNYPWDGAVTLRVQESSAASYDLRLRIPGWSRATSIRVNGEPLAAPHIENGYLVLNRAWKAGDVVELGFQMDPVFMEPNPRIDAVRDCLAIQRGPVVYCLESHDQEAELNLLDVEIDEQAQLHSTWRADLNGMMAVEAEGFALQPDEWAFDLYHPLAPAGAIPKRPVHLVAIPYYAWGNRGLKSMRVWIPKS